ncbi:MAG: hypothetical protein JO052_13430 [Bradyrhizobium sp.]|nr:hypothetical protein [Bradyrhizobium sp.]
MPVAGFCLAAVIVGLLAYRRYKARESSYAHIETSAEIAFIGQQDNFWVVELKAILNNKGKVQRRIHGFRFDLNAIHADDAIDVSKKWGGQVNFANEIAKGSFVPRGYAYCVVGPSVTATYSYVARVPQWATFLILHCWFDYNPGFSHWIEKAVQVPTAAARPDKRHEDAPFAASSLQPERLPGAGASADRPFAAPHRVESRELRTA